MKPGNRYAAHIALQPIGEQGQSRINSSRVLVVGLGGLGCPLSQYLAGAGVGELLLCDFDTVSESNLARQLLYRPADVGRHKADIARNRLSEQNPTVNIRTYKQRADQEFLSTVVDQVDLVADASDNYGTRLAVNRACLASGTPWVMGACIRMEGQVRLFEPASEDGGCYRCTYGEAPETLEDCPGAGIFAPVAGMAGTAMAQLALSRLAGLEVSQALNLLDGRTLQWRQLAVQRSPDCADCSNI